MVPEPERIERAAASLRDELERVLEESRELYRELQDVDAEQPVNGGAKRWLAHARLGDLEQRILVAQCDLVSPKDPRWNAAQRTARELRSRLLGGPLRGRERKRARSRLRVRQPEGEAA